MNPRHKAARRFIKKLPVPDAKIILRVNLPERESNAIYYADVEKYSLTEVADMLNCSESVVKRLRKSGYEKLANVDTFSSFL